MKLWNVGCKVEDVSAEIEFIRGVGGSIRPGESVVVNGKDTELIIASMGDTRILLFPHVSFEEALTREVSSGWTHAVFEVEDFAEAYSKFADSGARLLVDRTEIVGSFGRRRLAFFESPNGVVYEVFETLEDE